MAEFHLLSGLNVYTFLISATMCMFLFWIVMQRKTNIPPGPWIIPWIGYLTSLMYSLYRSGNELEKLLAKMAKQYGDVFCLHVGTAVIVVVNSYKSISEASLNPLLVGRPKSKILEETGFDKGIIVTSGKAWTSQRKLTLNIFRNFGVGKQSFEGSISTEAQMLVKLMSNNKDHPFDPESVIVKCVMNTVSAVIFGYQHDPSDIERILNVSETLLKKVGAGVTLLYVPFLRYLFPSRYNECKSIIFEARLLIDNLAKEHVDKFDGENLNNFIDVFINAIEHSKGNEYSKYINYESLLSTSLSVFVAGAETTASTLRWSLIYMVMYPEIQAKIHSELDTMIGRYRLPQWGDRSKLPYTEAVLLEVLRIRSVVPLVPHLAVEDTNLAGYDIPKDAIIVFNIWAVHHDPDLWPEPDDFKPERFLDDNGMCKPREELIPFSTGRRICLAENMARMELFLFFTHMLHKFNIRRSSPDQHYSFEGVSGFTYTPAPYEIIAEIRD